MKITQQIIVMSVFIAQNLDIVISSNQKLGEIIIVSLKMLYIERLKSKIINLNYFIKGGVYNEKKVDEIIVIKGNTCLNCYYFRIGGECVKNNCRLKVDEIYQKREIKDLQLKLF